MDFIEDENGLSEEIIKLPLMRAIAFSAFCCERLLPIYTAFCCMEGVGDPRIPKIALDFIWEGLDSQNWDVTLGSKLREQICEIEPQSDDFITIFAIPAIDAIDGFSSALESSINKDLKKTPIASSAVLTGLYHYIREVSEPDLYIGIIDGFEKECGSEHEFEEELWECPIMKREVKKQRHALAQLKAVDKLDRNFIDALRASGKRGGIDPFRRGLVSPILGTWSDEAEWLRRYNGMEGGKELEGCETTEAV